jgi:hypothetical protein
MEVGRDVPRRARASASPVDAAVGIDIRGSAAPGDLHDRGHVVLALSLHALAVAVGDASVR